MVTWIVKHGLCSPVTLTATIDHRLVIVELSDRGRLVPDPHVSKTDAEFAIWLLEAPAIEWGAGLDSRGRRLWIAFSAETAVVVADDDGSEQLWL